MSDALSPGAVDVLIIDDHPVFRGGLRMLLEGSGRVRVVGEAGSVSAAAEQLAARQPHVAILDIDLAGEDGLVALPALQRQSRETRFIVLTGIRDARRHEGALLAGARGLIVKDRSGDMIVDAIQKVHAGELCFDRALLEAAALTPAARDYSGAQPTGEATAALTPREREIVELVGAGLSNDDVARQLGLSEKTVRNRLTTIFEKLQVSGRVELLVYAYQHGLAKQRR